MQVNTLQFKKNARAALRNPGLQDALAKLETGLQARRRQAKVNLPEFDRLRARAEAIKKESIERLADYLEYFEQQVTSRRGQVHWARDTADARAIMLSICKSAGAGRVAKGKSMATEEIGLNDFLQAHGIDTVETDLGEYILQLRDEPPSHIVVPAFHLKQGDIRSTFLHHHRALPPGRRLDSPAALLKEAKRQLRDTFLQAEVGITGANFLIAETGQTVIVTNEGNGDLARCLPKVHIVLAGIEKIIPNRHDAATLLRLLARSATGQDMTAYVSFTSGPRRKACDEGPEELHVILLDNGRAELIGTENESILNCIRCGACMNHCPVYAAVGGHSYGWVYPGPLGAALNPGLLGAKTAHHLPNASSLCGRCRAVCPVNIPLPDIMRNWRTSLYKKTKPLSIERFGLSIWRWLVLHPQLYNALAQYVSSALNKLARGRGYVRWLPFAAAWTRHHDLPAPTGVTFQQQWRQRMDHADGR